MQADEGQRSLAEGPEAVPPRPASASLAHALARSLVLVLALACPAAPVLAHEGEVGGPQPGTLGVRGGGGGGKK